MKLEISKRSIEREKQALKRAQKAGYSRSQAKTLLRRYYREGNDDSAKLDDWIRKMEKKRGNRMIPKLNRRKSKAKEFSEDEISEKEKELAERVLQGREFGVDLNEFRDIELKAAAKQLGLNVKGKLTKERLIQKIDEALCKPPECSREEPKYLKEISKKINEQKMVESKMKKKMKKKAKVKKKVDKLPTKAISGILKKVKLRKVTIAEILPFSMPKMF